MGACLLLSNASVNFFGASFFCLFCYFELFNSLSFTLGSSFFGFGLFGFCFAKYIYPLFFFNLKCFLNEFFYLRLLVCINWDSLSCSDRIWTHISLKHQSLSDWKALRAEITKGLSFRWSYQDAFSLCHSTLHSVPLPFSHFLHTSAL